jgi:hypothetical protein
VQTTDFFDLVLPVEGLRCVATLERDSDSFEHQFFADNDHAAARTLELDRAAGASVYYACASYRTSINRKGKNAAKVRSFWLDVDCGPTKPYPTVEAGVRALAAFKKRLNLPRPWIVSSGCGLHVYWVMDADMSPDEWRGTALALKAATLDLKLQVDQSRTADITSVLRAVGTHHRKGDEKDVALIMEGALMSKPLA